MIFSINKINNYVEAKQLLNEFSECLKSLSRGEKYRAAMADKFINLGHIITAVNDEGNIGFAAFYANDYTGKTAFLSMIAVKAEYRGNCVGEVLLKNFSDISQNKGMKVLELEVAKNNLKAIRFYKKNGFVEFTDASKETLYMKKNIGGGI